MGSLEWDPCFLDTSHKFMSVWGLELAQIYKYSPTATDMDKKSG